MRQRTMDALYWIGRYVERVENHARCLEAWCAMQPQSQQGRRLLEHVVMRLGDPVVHAQPMDSEAIELTYLPYLIWDAHHSNSIFSCITHVRHNLKETRSRLPDELWEQWNRLYLWFAEQDCATQFRESPAVFLRSVIRFVSVFVGIAQQMMWRDDLWTAMRCGQGLERADHIARFAGAILHWVEEQAYIDPLILKPALLLMGEIDEYRFPTGQGVCLSDVVAMLVKQATYPRSVLFSLLQLEHHAQQWARLRTDRASERLYVRIMKLRAELVLWSEDDRALLSYLGYELDAIGRTLYEQMTLTTEVMT